LNTKYGTYCTGRARKSNSKFLIFRNVGEILFQPKFSLKSALAKNTHENAFFAIFKRVYPCFGARYDIHHLSDDFYGLNPHFLKFSPRSDKKQQKCFFSSACTFSPSGRSGPKISEKMSPGDIWPRLQWYVIICRINTQYTRLKFGGLHKKNFQWHFVL
jgi:hypothetical protein